MNKIGKGSVYFYEPSNTALKEWEVEVRAIRRFYLEKVAGWYKKDAAFSIETKATFDGSYGYWQVTTSDEESYLKNCPTSKCIINFGDSKIFSYLPDEN